VGFEPQNLPAWGRLRLYGRDGGREKAR
jgi:hypothetical protein